MGAGQPWVQRGHLVLAAAFVFAFTAGPGHTTSFNMFVDDIMQSLQLSRTTVSMAWAGGMALSSAMLPFAGQFADKHGCRRLALISAVGLGVALARLPRAGGVASLTVTIGLLRFFGPEALCLTSSTLVNKWFVRHRGMAMTVRGLADILAMSLPGWLAPAHRALGWGRLCYVLGAASLAANLVAWWAVRDSPEAVGERPDCDGRGLWSTPGSARAPDLSGAEAEKRLDSLHAHAHSRHSPRPQPHAAVPPPPAAQPVGAQAPPAVTPTPGEAESWTLREATRTFVFWVILLGQCSVCVFWSGLNLHRVDFFGLRGIGEAEVAELSKVFSAAMLVVSVGFGSVLDRVENKLVVLGVGNLAYAACIGVAWAAHTWWQCLGFFLLFAASNGVIFTTGGVVLADLFGRGHIGAISGVATGLWTLSSGVGPLVFGLDRDLAGDYTAVLAATVLCNLLSAASFLSMPAARPPRGRRGGQPAVATL